MEYTDNNPLKLIELFAGIGSQTQALKNIGVPHEVVAISEIDKYAVLSYEAMHGKVNNMGDIRSITELPKADTWTYSFPCTDCSVAGKLAGLKKRQRNTKRIALGSRKVAFNSAKERNAAEIPTIRKRKKSCEQEIQSRLRQLAFLFVRARIRKLLEGTQRKRLRSSAEPGACILRIDTRFAYAVCIPGKARAKTAAP